MSDNTLKKLPANKLHLFDLPLEILDEIIKKLDTDSIERLGRTCKYLKDHIKNFKENYQELLKQKLLLERAYIDDISDESELMDAFYNNDEDYGDDVDDLDDLYDMDRLSYGSNYDEELDELINGR